MMVLATVPSCPGLDHEDSVLWMQPVPQPISTSDAIPALRDVILVLCALATLGTALWRTPRKLDTKIAVLRLFMSSTRSLALLFSGIVFVTTDSIPIAALLAVYALLVEIGLFLTKSSSPNRLEIVSMILTTGFIFLPPPLFLISKLISVDRGIQEVITNIVSHLEKRQSANQTAPTKP
jgi:hypothetical protein